MYDIYRTLYGLNFWSNVNFLKIIRQFKIISSSTHPEKLVKIQVDAVQTMPPVPGCVSGQFFVIRIPRSFQAFEATGNPAEIPYPLLVHAEAWSELFRTAEC